MKEKIFEKMREYGWNLGNNTNKDFADIYDTHCGFIDGCYDYIADLTLEPLNMNDISADGFEDMITFISDFLRALNEIDTPKMQEKLSNYGYHWLGMKEVDYKTALKLYDEGESIYLLYEDNTESLVENKEEIHQHRANGGLFGIELVDDYHYVTFILGRDLLKGVLPYEDDLAYEFCKKVANDFVHSIYNNASKGLYVCLEKYVRDNFYLKDGEITWRGEKIQ